jgi:hypothetical protein
MEAFRRLRRNISKSPKRVPITQMSGEQLQQWLKEMGERKERNKEQFDSIVEHSRATGAFSFAQIPSSYVENIVGRENNIEIYLTKDGASAEEAKSHVRRSIKGYFLHDNPDFKQIWITIEEDQSASRSNLRDSTVCLRGAVLEGRDRWVRLPPKKIAAGEIHRGRELCMDAESGDEHLLRGWSVMQVDINGVHMFEGELLRFRK